MIKIGDKVKFDHLNGICIRGLPYGAYVVKGTVIEIHEDHKWFAVEYFLDGNVKMRTSFNFADIGVTVFLCK